MRVSLNRPNSLDTERTLAPPYFYHSSGAVMHFATAINHQVSPTLAKARGLL